MIARLKNLGASTDMLLDLYKIHVRRVLEYATPVWNSGLTNCDKNEIERVQKTAFLVIFNEKSYTKKLELANMERLGDRRDICKKKCKQQKSDPKNTRQKNAKYDEPKYRCQRLRESPIPYLTRLLNEA